jgi:hypothetical protein
MKIDKTQKILSFLTLMFLFSSCIKEGEFDLPNIEIEEPNIIANSDITAIKSALMQEFTSNSNLTYTFFDKPDNPTYIEGYVVSSDASGNFYKTLIIQDNPTKPTAGIEINLNDTSLSESYQVGQKIYVKLDGLSVSYDNGESKIDPTKGIPGKYILGELVGKNVKEIPSTKIKKHIFRTNTITEITPTLISLTEITGANINTLIELTAVQFAKDNLGKTFSGEPNDSFDGFRDIVECSTQATVNLQTATFSSFKSNVVPSGKGSISAVLSKDFKSEFLVLILNTPSDISFTDTDRCDPLESDCGLSTSEGSNILFSDDFERQSNNSLISGNGWTNYIQEGTEGWKAFSSSIVSNPSLGISATISSRNTSDNKTISWLITPAIDLDANTETTIKFETSNSFSDNSRMELLFSNDWDGTTNGVSSATWSILSAAYITLDSDSNVPWYKSGIVNLSCVSGTTTYFAFRYNGKNTGGYDGTYELDNIKISSN